MKARKYLLAFLGAAGLILAFSVLCAIFVPEERKELSVYGAWDVAKQFVTDRLQTPSTADFGDGAWTDPEQSAEKCVTSLGNGCYSVAGWVDAQNVYGTRVRIDWTCTVRFVYDRNWRCEEIELKPR